MFVGIKSHQRLNNGRGDLKHSSDKSYLCETDGKLRLQHRVDSRQHRADGIIEQMTKAHSEKNRKCRIFHLRRRNMFVLHLQNCSQITDSTLHRIAWHSCQNLPGTLLSSHMIRVSGLHSSSQTRVQRYKKKVSRKPFGIRILQKNAAIPSLKSFYFK